MTTRRGPRMLLMLALFASFCAGMVFDGWLRTIVPLLLVHVAGAPAPPGPELSRTKPSPEALPSEPPRADPALEAVQLPPVSMPLPAVVVPLAPGAGPPGPVAVTMAAVDVATLAALMVPRLRVPIDGVSIESFKGGFAQSRGDRPHEAVDIMAPRGTPVHAAQDGTIAKLFVSKLGGITIYEFEEDGWLCFYYAHLERYADLLHEGQRVSRGEIIGYVGSTGNASSSAPHLHFAISQLNPDRKWWQGRALDPYLVFKDREDH